MALLILAGLVVSIAGGIALALSGGDTTTSTPDEGAGAAPGNVAPATMEDATGTRTVSVTATTAPTTTPEPQPTPDGVVRIVLCVALATIGITAPGPYGFVVALAPLVAVVAVTARGQLRTDDGPEAEWHEVTQNLGWLLAGTVCAAGLLNAGPLAARLLADEGYDELITRFGYGVLLARVPLFLFQAVQAALLPRLSRLAARGEFDEFRSGFSTLMKLVTVVGVVGTIGAYVLGPFVIELVYDTELGRPTLAMLALSSAIYMAGLATAQAVIALQGHRWVALGWTVGVVVFVLGTWLSSDLLFRRIEIGLVLSSASALTVFAMALRQKLTTGAVPTSGSIMDAITDMPIDG